MRTLLLDRTAWDLVLDAEGNLAIASGPYALAQDAACAARLFKNEAYYNTAIGIPYFEAILGVRPDFQFMRIQYELAAARVPEVVKSKVEFNDLKGRQLEGQVLIQDVSGASSLMGF